MQHPQSDGDKGEDRLERKEGKGRRVGNCPGKEVWMGLGNNRRVEKHLGDTVTTLGLEGQAEGVFAQTQGEL